jgi:hypothetical protein
MVASMKLDISFVVALCSLAEVHRHLRGARCLHYQVDECSHCPDDGGSKHLSNVGKLLLGYMLLQPRRQPSSYLSFVSSKHNSSASQFWRIPIV